MKTSLPAAALLAAAAVLGAPAAASAHDSLTTGAPGAGETVTAQPGSVRLTYSGTLLDVSGTGESFALRVVGPDGRYYERSCPVLVDDTSEAAVDLGGAGTYTVQWQVVSSDGHPVSDEYAFDYAPTGDQPVAAGTAEPFPCGIAAADDGAGAAPEGGEEDAPVTDTGTGGASDAPVVEQGTGATQEDGTGTAIVIAAGVAAATLVAVVAIVLVARRRRPGDDD